MQFPRSHRRIEGFTLTELLVVIGIIIILIGITLPVIKKMRYAAYTADTQNEISQISNACTQYYTSFHAYPGPFSNDEIAGQIGSATSRTFAAPGFGPVSLTSLYYNGNTSALTALPWTVTGAQNLVLGLMGGLRVNTVNPLSLAFAPSEVGLGPLNLNPVNPSRTPSFFSTGSNYLMWCQKNSGGQFIQSTGAYQNMTGATPPPMDTPFTDPAGAQATDCPLPLFVDRYPTQLPILYLRARTGASGVVSDNSTVVNVLYQYDMRDIYPYTLSHIGLPATDNGGAPNSHNLCGITITNFPANGGSVLSNSAAPHPAQIQNCGPYFANGTITPTNSGDPNGSGRPKAVDQYILISAGPDGVYGTSDDVTSFGGF